MCKLKHKVSGGGWVFLFLFSIVFHVIQKGGMGVQSPLDML